MAVAKDYDGFFIWAFTLGMCWSCISNMWFAGRLKWWLWQLTKRGAGCRERAQFTFVTSLIGAAKLDSTAKRLRKQTPWTWRVRLISFMFCFPSKLFPVIVLQSQQQNFIIKWQTLQCDEYYYQRNRSKPPQISRIESRWLYPEQMVWFWTDIAEIGYINATPFQFH